jgi:hypothetical protein
MAHCKFTVQVCPLSLAPCGEMRDDSFVSTVAEIKQAIARLSPQEYCELMAELLPPREDDEWDKQMKADAAAGKFDEMNRRALAEHEAGQTEEWP